MSTGSKHAGPRDPKGLQLPGKRSRRPVSGRKSPRVPVTLHSNSSRAVSGSAYESGATGTFAASQLQGVVVQAGARETYPAMNTNANRAHGGSGTFYRQREGWGY